MTKGLFLRFRHSFFRCFEPNFRMGAVAKRFLGRCAATAERHALFDRELVSIGVDQFHFACHDVRAMLDCFDFYVSHDAR
jgi:hypothetical protein